MEKDPFDRPEELLTRAATTLSEALKHVPEWRIASGPLRDEIRALLADLRAEGWRPAPRK